MNIRKASLKDCPKIAAIYNMYLGKATLDIEKKPAEYFMDFISNSTDREAIFVSEVFGEVKAWGIIKRYSDRGGYRYACETSVYVNEFDRGRGYGKQLKMHIMSECKRLQYNHLVAKIFSTNKHSINYNLKLGYTIVGIQQNIGRVNGEWVDIVIMQYLVPQTKTNQVQQDHSVNR